jgi:hypothetical protein
MMKNVMKSFIIYFVTMVTLLVSMVPAVTEAIHANDGTPEGTEISVYAKLSGTFTFKAEYYSTESGLYHVNLEIDATDETIVTGTISATGVRRDENAPGSVLIFGAGGVRFAGPPDMTGISRWPDGSIRKIVFDQIPCDGGRIRYIDADGKKRIGVATDARIDFVLDEQQNIVVVRVWIQGYGKDGAGFCPIVGIGGQDLVIQELLIEEVAQ